MKNCNKSKIQIKFVMSLRMSFTIENTEILTDSSFLSRIKPNLMIRAKCDPNSLIVSDKTNYKPIKHLNSHSRRLFAILGAYKLGFYEKIFHNYTSPIFELNSNKSKVKESQYCQEIEVDFYDLQKRFRRKRFIKFAVSLRNFEHLKILKMIYSLGDIIDTNFISKSIKMMLNLEQLYIDAKDCLEINSISGKNFFHSAKNMNKLKVFEFMGSNCCKIRREGKTSIISKLKSIYQFNIEVLLKCCSIFKHQNRIEELQMNLQETNLMNASQLDQFWDSIKALKNVKALKMNISKGSLTPHCNFQSFSNYIRNISKIQYLELDLSYCNELNNPYIDKFSKFWTSQDRLVSLKLNLKNSLLNDITLVALGEMAEKTIVLQNLDLNLSGNKDLTSFGFESLVSGLLNNQSIATINLEITSTTFDDSLALTSLLNYIQRKQERVIFDLKVGKYSLRNKNNAEKIEFEFETYVDPEDNLFQAAENIFSNLKNIHSVKLSYSFVKLPFDMIEKYLTIIQKSANKLESLHLSLERCKFELKEGYDFSQLGKRISELSTLKKLAINYSSIKAFSEALLSSISLALSALNISEIKISFGDCTEISSYTFKKLAQALRCQFGMTSLILKFQAYTSLKNDDLLELCESLQDLKGLKKLHLSFPLEFKLTTLLKSNGMKILINSIRACTSIEVFKFEFPFVKIFNEGHITEICKTLEQMKSLKKLCLNLYDCGDMKLNSIFKFLGKRELRFLKILMGNNSMIDDFCVEEFISVIDKMNLEKLDLNFQNCKNISRPMDAKVREFVKMKGVN